MSQSGNAPEPTDEEALTGRACEATSKRSKPLELSVFPDDGEAAFVDMLHRASQSIRLMVYMLGRDGIFDELVAKAHAGKDVRVILDGNKQRAFNQRAFDELTAAGASVKWSDPKFPFMHAKAFVVDGKEAMISTGNFPLGLLQHERNYAVHDIDRADVKGLMVIFDADFDGSDPNLDCTRLVVSPVNSKQRILDLIDSADESLLVESLELADSQVMAKLLAKKADGKEVRVVLADPNWNASNDNAASARKLKRADIPVRFIPKSRMLVHVKSIMVDGKRAYLGSENMTTTSLEKNREVGVVVTDAPVVKKMTETFNGDFDSAQEF